MIICNLMGGLGNQLFQIFATISTSINYRCQFKFPNDEILGGGICTERHTYWKSFLSNLKIFLIDKTKISFENSLMIKEKNFTYNKIILNMQNNVNMNNILVGYFQSYKYFEENYHTICRLIGLENKKNSVMQKISTNVDFNKTISIHFRYGDYKKYQQFHPLMSYDYYKNSIQFYSCNNDINTVIYFCEKEDLEEINKNMIEPLKKEFSRYTFIHSYELCSDLDDWEEMLLMSFCSHNIIANSSFSWWAAYFNNNPNKIVCYPSLWFNSSSHDTKDLFPEEWIKISV